MASFVSCSKCTWVYRGKSEATCSRAATSHMLKCEHREGNAAAGLRLAKRGIPDVDMGGADGDLLEPPQKVPRLLVVSVSRRCIYEVCDSINGTGIG
jgi:hypothetical protein